MRATLETHPGCRYGHGREVLYESGGLVRCRLCARESQRRAYHHQCDRRSRRLGRRSSVESRGTLRRYAYDYVPNRELREAVESYVGRTGTVWAEIARRLDWIHSTKTGHGDTTRLRRCLGCIHNGGYFNKHIHLDDATAIARAIHVDPWEVGL